MNTVQTISLNGRSIQVDDGAYHALHEYLAAAKKALAHDPDQAEILQDLEQSIADKCAARLVDNKDVVPATDMTEVLAALGPVEPSDETSLPDAKKRHLYLIQDGAMLAGVCKGLAAFINIEVVIVRVVFVILTLLTHGAMILVYVLLALLLPKADDSEKLAAAYGYTANAKEVIERARKRATDPAMLGTVGSTMTRLWQFIIRCLMAAVILASMLLTVGWGVGLWAIGLGRTQLLGSLVQYNGWPQWAALTALYLALLIPAIAVIRLLHQLLVRRPITRQGLVTNFGLAGLWIVSVVTVVSLVGFAASDFRSYAYAHNGYIDFTNGHICVQDSLCNPDHATTCRDDGSCKLWACPIAIQAMTPPAGPSCPPPLH